MQNALIQVKIDQHIKNNATAIYNSLGLDLPTAIRIFLNASIQKNGLPFDLNLSTLQKNKKRSVKEFFGTMDDQTFEEMNQALKDCSQIDAGEW
ncbi:MAG: type II toxin-antitoxin system RelB/DinJ family antitoxin [Treponema sp.]|nr:type II toxin-antitoxin system RelB/DinJ family antitoxin [Candidatus Treponema equifaecale]